MNFHSIVFFNFFNNGDIHLSRGFVRYIIQRVSQQKPDVKFYYAHKNGPEILADIPDLKYDQSMLKSIANFKCESFIRNDILFINTWYGANNYAYMNAHAISFDTLYLLFEDACKTFFNFSLSEAPLQKLFPIIDFPKYKLDGVKEFVNRCPGPKVLVANGFAQSGQADNFNLGWTISRLADNYHGVWFILTNKEEGLPLRNNMIYSADIINKTGSDLNENAYLNLSCGLTVGRASGVHSFCLNQENLFNKKNTLLSFSNLSFPGPYWLHNKFKDIISYSAVVKNFDVNTSDAAEVIIDENIHSLWVKK